jgi:hypothetical protein
LLVFERFFEQIVQLCCEAGLVWGQELYFDGTRVQANASMQKTRPRFYLQAKEHVVQLFADENEAASESPTLSPKEDEIALGASSLVERYGTYQETERSASR